VSTLTAEAEKTGVSPVDQVPPLRQLIPLGLQHVLAMYAGAVAVISAGAITAIVLNLLLNSEKRQKQFASGDDLAAYDASRGAQTDAADGLPGTTGAVSEPLEVDHP